MKCKNLKRNTITTPNARNMNECMQHEKHVWQFLFSLLEMNWKELQFITSIIVIISYKISRILPNKQLTTNFINFESACFIRFLLTFQPHVLSTQNLQKYIYQKLCDTIPNVQHLRWVYIALEACFERKKYVLFVDPT